MCDGVRFTFPRGESEPMNTDTLFDRLHFTGRRQRASQDPIKLVNPSNTNQLFASCKVIPSTPAKKMSPFKPTSDERDTLKIAVSKFVHHPTKSQLLFRLGEEDSEYSSGTEEWNHLKYCIEQHHLHVQTEMRRDPKRKFVRLQLGKADALVRKFHPNFS